jgi:hypothetical protein
MAVDATGWDDAWNKPDSELTDDERAAIRRYTNHQMWQARYARYMQVPRPLPPGEVLGDVDEPPHHDEKMGVRWLRFSAWLILPFVLLALLVVGLAVFGHLQFG